MKQIDLKKYSGLNANKRRILALYKRLDCAYGPFEPKKKLKPIEELILTVLSQNTNDVNRDRAWVNLITKFPSWNSVLDAKDSDIENAIRVGGLAHNKTRSIKAILGKIKSEHADFNLEHLKSMPLDQAIDELLALPGVGLKTACCVMLFSFGRQQCLSIRTCIVLHRDSVWSPKRQLRIKPITC
jgi:endonuclease III